MNHYSIIMKNTAIFGIFLLTSLLTGTTLNMNMFSPALAATGQGIVQYDYKNANPPTYEKDPYAKSPSNSYNYDNNQSKYGKDPYAKSYDYKNANPPTYEKDPYAKSPSNSYNYDNNQSKYGKDPYANSYNYN